VQNHTTLNGGGSQRHVLVRSRDSLKVLALIFQCIRGERIRYLENNLKQIRSLIG